MMTQEWEQATTPWRYAILGTGALGGFYGIRLQQAGSDVHFLLHRDFHQVQQQGLVLESPHGNVRLSQVNAYPSVSAMPRCQVVIVALKSIHNQVLGEWLPRVLADDGVVLVMQNGLNLEPAIASIVGNERVMGGLCFLCSNKVGPGQIRHLDYGVVTLGDYGPNYQPMGITARMQRVAADFQRAGIPVTLIEDLLLARWKKLVWNVPFNGLSVVLNAQVDALIQHPATQALARELMGEVVAIAASQKRIIPEDFIQTMVADTLKMKPYRTSMKLDYDSGRPMELVALYANPLQVAQQHHVPAPRITQLYQQLQFLNDGLLAHATHSA